MPVITEERRLENRKKLLRCTYQLYNSNGENMTTQMVFTEAKVGKGTLFNYFPTEDGTIIGGLYAIPYHRQLKKGIIITF